MHLATSLARSVARAGIAIGLVRLPWPTQWHGRQPVRPDTLAGPAVLNGLMLGAGPSQPMAQ